MQDLQKLSKNVETITNQARNELRNKPKMSKMQKPQQIERKYKNNNKIDTKQDQSKLLKFKPKVKTIKNQAKIQKLQ